MSFGAAMLPSVQIHIKGRTGLLIAAAIITTVLVAFPAYRVVFAVSLAISVGIGIIVAALLYLRNKYRPIREEDVETKRPLGLD
jgi:lysylphosphatidylglycerol synthetase-like protein (DUF2156 family)